jgi:hypothetical protein
MYYDFKVKIPKVKGKIYERTIKGVVYCIRRNQVAAFAAMSGHGAERVAGLK